RGPPPRSRQPVHLVLAEQPGDALREAVDDLLLADHHRGQIERHVADAHPVRAQPVARQVVVLARVEQRLARDAADVQTRDAERDVLLDADDVHAELRGPDGAGVSRRARADDDEVDALGHQTSSRSRAGSSRRSFTRTRKVTACSPSTRRWSYDSARYIIGRTTI